jgi:hypothetical protein
VGPLQNQSSLSECNSAASSTAFGSALVFIGNGAGTQSRMNIGGTDVRLRLVSQSGHLSKPGTVLVQTFRAPGIVVTARSTASQSCSEEYELCQTQVIFHVSKGKRHQVVRATGSVGC